MKFMCKSLVCGLAVAAFSALGCSSGHSTGSTNPTGPGSKTGDVGLNLTLQGGQTLTGLNYSLAATGEPTLTGTIPLPTGTAGAGPIVVSTYEIIPVAAATGYTITLSGTSTGTGPVVTCSGTAGPFAVTAGNETVVSVLVTCTTTNTSGSVEVNATIQNCPTEGTLTAINATATTSPNAGDTSTIFAAAVSPNQATLTYAFSVTSGHGTLTGQTTAAGNASSSIVFTCPTTGEADTIQVVTADQTGATCPASLTTASVTVTCGSVPCVGIGTATVATPDTAAGTCPTGQSNTLTDSSGNFCCAQKACFNGATQVGTGVEATPDTAAGTCPSGSFNDVNDSAGNFCCSSTAPTLVACTTAAMVTACNSGTHPCVECSGNASGICSATEADFVGRDIALGLVTTPCASDTAATNCYPCLWGSSCIDDTVQSDVNHECEDPITTGTSAQCEAVVQCVLASGTGAAECASSGVGTCYCGTDPQSSCGSGSSSSPVTAGVNGACASQIATALGFPLGDGADIGPNFNAIGRAGGRADQIFTCAASNSCNSCL